MFTCQCTSIARNNSDFFSFCVVLASSAGGDESEPVGDKVETLKFRLNLVRDLQKDVDRLREMLSDKYAQELGDQINCTQQ